MAYFVIPLVYWILGASIESTLQRGTVDLELSCRVHFKKSRIS